MSLKTYLKQRRRIRRKQDERRNSVQSELLKPALLQMEWNQNGETISLRDWFERKIENAGFSGGDELELIVSAICERIAVPDLVFVSPKYIDGKGVEKEICDLLVLHKGAMIAFQVKHRVLSEQKSSDVILQRAEKTYKHAMSQFETFVAMVQSKSEFVVKNNRGYDVTIRLDEYPRKELVALVCFPGKSEFTDENRFDIVNSFELFRGFSSHVFDVDDFDKITREFDTTSDLLRFLSIRRKFFRESNFSVVKDLDLVASIKINYDDVWKEFESSDDQISIYLEDGVWDSYVNNSRKAILRRASLSKESYMFDLILKMAHRAIGFDVGFSVEEHEKCKEKIGSIDAHIQIMLNFDCFPRLARRGLARGIIETIHRASNNNRMGRPYAFRCLKGDDGVGFVFLSVVDSKIPRFDRIRMLHNLCSTASCKFSMETVVGIASESLETISRSEDFIVFYGHHIGDSEEDRRFKHTAEMIWAGEPVHTTTVEYQEE